jgi:hypothetical protein
MARLELRQRFGPTPKAPATRSTPPSTAAAGRCQPRPAHRTHRIRPPPRLARAVGHVDLSPPTASPDNSRNWSTSTCRSATCCRRSSCRSRRKDGAGLCQGARLRADRLGRHVLGPQAAGATKAWGPRRRARIRSWRAAMWSTWSPTMRGTRSWRRSRRRRARWSPSTRTDGSIAALVGGFDYFTNKYNRVTQAKRLPGSGFKPFLYSAALENGFTPASTLLDAPFVLEGQGIESSWRPENSARPVRRTDPPAGGARQIAQPGHDPPAA